MGTGAFLKSLERKWPYAAVALDVVPQRNRADPCAVVCSLRFAPFGRLFALGGFVEDYEIKDVATNGLTNYVPASFFLAANDGDYTAKVAYVRFTYRF